jgi:hypothetical protein
MRPVSRFVALAGLACASVVGLGPAWSQSEAPPARSPRGGLIAKSGQHQFEVFFFPSGVRVYPQGPAGEPLDVSRATATATFYHPNSPKPWFSRPLAPEAVAPGQAPASLEHAIGLANVPARGARVTFEVSGVPGPAGSTATFTVPFEFVPAPAPVAPAASAAAPAAVAPAPRYVYGYGYAGYGYYEYNAGDAYHPAPGYYYVAPAIGTAAPRPTYGWVGTQPSPSDVTWHGQVPGSYATQRVHGTNPNYYHEYLHPRAADLGGP